MLNARMLERMKVNKKGEQIDEEGKVVGKRARMEDKKQNKRRQEEFTDSE